MQRTSLTLFFILLLNACSSVQTGSTCVVEDDYFDENRELTWADEFAKIGGDPLNAIGPVTLEQIKMEVERQFQTLGYNFADDETSADMRISFVVATREEIVRGTYVYHDPYCWGNFRHPDFMSDREQVSKEAFLAIDLVEVNTGRSVWRGWAEKPVNDYDRHNPELLMKEAITSILAELPYRIDLEQ
jgi:hypothetical protein